MTPLAIQSVVHLAIQKLLRVRAPRATRELPMKVSDSFGNWLRSRRKVLDLTQFDLADQVGCSAITIRKIETDERRPSKQIAERLADVLAISLEEREEFIAFARHGETLPTVPSLPSAVAPRHNLPPQLTSFVGRADELAL